MTRTVWCFSCAKFVAVGSTDCAHVTDRFETEETTS